MAVNTWIGDGAVNGGRANDIINDNFFSKLDGSNLKNSIKNINKDVRYIEIVGQEEYNTNSFSNDTLYFINNITEQLSTLYNVLDVAFSNNNKNNSLFPEKIWVLTLDDEMEEVDLYCATFRKGGTQIGNFSLIKRYPGCIDGRLTFDGVFEFIDNSALPSLITKDEPFVVLITNDGSLYAIPSIKYDIKNEGTGEERTWCIAGPNKEEPEHPVASSSDLEETEPIEQIEPYYCKGQVVTCSVEKGYFSDLLRKEDQGIIVAYGLKDENDNYHLNYIQYGYDNDDSKTKTWGPHCQICSVPGAIYWIALRRLTDYRVGITYNYWDGNVSRAKFRYTARTYAGIAYKPDTIEINPIPKMGPILYGAVRNDDIARIEKPFLGPGEEAINDGDKVKIYFELMTGDPNKPSKVDIKKVQIQILNKDKLDKIEEEDLNNESLASGDNASEEDYSSFEDESIIQWQDDEDEVEMIVPVGGETPIIPDQTNSQSTVNQSTTWKSGFDNPDQISQKSEREETTTIDDILKIGLKIVNDYPYSNYTTMNDPFFGNGTMAKAEIEKVQSEDNKIILTLKGKNLPMTPFIITTEIDEQWKNRINIRYVGDDFSGLLDRELNKTLQISGWFALDEIAPVSIGAVHWNDLPSQNHLYIDFNKLVIVSQTIKSYKSIVGHRDVIFEVGLGVNYLLNNHSTLEHEQFVLENKEGYVSVGSLTKGVSSFRLVVGSNINV